MSRLRGFRDRMTSFFLGTRGETPVIMTQYGPVDERARHAAALNMLEHPEVRVAVEQLLARQLGSVARGLAEAKRRYPEVYLDLKGDA